MGQPEVVEERPAVDRPWTVYVLVVLSIGGLVWGQVVDVERTLWDVAAIVLSLLLVWGLWTGKQMAFSISFMLSSLCAALALGVVLVQGFLMESSPNLGLIVTGVVSALWCFLLLRPESRRFAGLNKESVWANSGSDDSSPRAWIAVVAFIVVMVALAIWGAADSFA